MLRYMHAVGEAAADAQLHLVLGLVLAVAAAALGIPEHRLSQGVLAGQLRHIVGNAVFVDEVLRLKLAVFQLVAEAEGHLLMAFAEKGNLDTFRQKLNTAYSAATILYDEAVTA